MVTKHIILNYDLGLKGDYSGLYAFLDNHEALDTGNCNAAFAMQFSENEFPIIYNELKEIIQKSVTIESTDRIYMLATDSSNNMRGQFLFGSRKRPIWEGYGNVTSEEVDEF